MPKRRVAEEIFRALLKCSVAVKIHRKHTTPKLGCCKQGQTFRQQTVSISTQARESNFKKIYDILIVGS